MACQLTLLWRFREGIDLNVQDDVNHLTQGGSLADGRWHEVNYAYSLPLTCVFALTEQLGFSPRLQADLVLVGCALAATIALWWALRSLLDPASGFLAACWWAGSTVALPRGFHDASSHVLGLALVALGIGLVARGRPYSALAVMVVATLNHGEIALWVLLAGVLWIALGRREDARSLRRAGWWYALSGGALVSLSRLGWRSGERLWLAFRQHFCWGHPEHAAAEEVFPGAASITDALRADPGAFGAHVARNLVDLPGALGRLVLDTWDWIPWLQPALIVALLGLAVLGGARRVLARPRPAPARGSGVVLFLGAASPAIAVSLVLVPRPALLASLLPMALFFLFGSAASGWQALTARVAPIRSYGRMLPAVVTLAVLVVGGPFRRSVVAAGGPSPGPGEARTPHRAAVELLRERVQPGEILLAAQADALLLYAELEGVRGISPTSLDFQVEHGRLDLRTVAERFRPGLLLDTPLLRADPARCQQLESMLRSGDWRLIESRSGADLYARAP